MAAVKDLTDLAPETRRLLESDFNPLINSLSYDGFSKALLEWARKRQNSGAQAEAAFDEFAAETKAWNRLLSEIGRKYAGEAVTLRQFLRELDLAPQTPPREK
ncbi:MAG: hypothetical protein LBJ64_02085, partial [Deltaproteobacteria bacterium]|nr:hypothetical protein [Deltaproteobacteria bacterium]